jgi:hypothetical protein
LKRKHRAYGDTFFIDEVFVKINGKQHYLWRAVDQDGDVVDVFLQAPRFLGAILSEQSTIEISGKVRLQNGPGRLFETRV